MLTRAEEKREEEKRQRERQEKEKKASKQKVSEQPDLTPPPEEGEGYFYNPVGHPQYLPGKQPVVGSRVPGTSRESESYLSPSSVGLGRGGFGVGGGLHGAVGGGASGVLEQLVL